MTRKDYYQILGVDKNVSVEEIKKAYRKLSLEYHPDRNYGKSEKEKKVAEEKFKEINEAKEVLTDLEKRKKYDQYGKDWAHADQFEQAKRAQQQQPFGGGGQSFSSDDFGGGAFSEFFESLFGGGGHSRSYGGRSAKYRGQDYESELKINLTDAFTTHKQTITVNGKNIRFTIPAGIEDGQKIRLKAHGGEGVNGGPAGDLYITFSIVNNTPFKRVGSDLYLTQDIDLYTALLGGEITIDTLSGKVKLKIKPETQNGTKVRLKEKGYPVYKQEGQFGDLYITLNVKLPTNLTHQQKELIKQLSEMK